MHLMFAAGLLALLLPSNPAAYQAPAQPSRPPQAVAPAAPPRAIATHSSKGVIQSITASALVITRRVAGRSIETSFAVTPSTERAGVVSAGRLVEVRYRTEGSKRVATTITGEAAPR
jgi:hypothetical protein